jgi:hypothetical protein
VEYSFSATLMVVLIGFYSGITDITTVIVIVGANVAMILFGWLQERMNPPGRDHHHDDRVLVRHGRRYRPVDRHRDQRRRCGPCRGSCTASWLPSCCSSSASG